MNSDNSTVKNHLVPHFIPVLFIFLFVALALGICLSFWIILKGKTGLWIFFETGVLFVLLICSVISFFRYRKCERFLKLYLEGNGDELLSMIGLSYSGGFSGLLGTQRKKSDKVLLEENLRQSQYRALQNQINPHFLYNTLEAIRSEALIGGLNGVADMCETLANYFRYTISKTTSLVTLADEIRNVQDYFKIQQFRFGERIRLEINVPVEGESGFYRVPKLILQPIVENAVIHGLEGKLEGGTIKIGMKISEGNFYILIEDNGVGMSEKELVELNRNLGNPFAVKNGMEHGGIAILNVNERIQLLYGPRYGLTYYSMNQIGTTVEICLPRFPDPNFLEC